MLAGRLLRCVSRGACRRGFAGDAAAAGAHTSLYDFHVENGGKMVNFGGFMLPVQYGDQSITNSHNFTRASASLFDVSHMLQTEITGKDSIAYLETIVTANLQDLPIDSSVLTIFTDENGGILDDLIITKIQQDHLFVVSNAGRKDHDQIHMTRALEDLKKRVKNAQVNVRFFEPKHRALLALQGPKAAETLQKFTDLDLSKLYFMTSAVGTVAGMSGCRITRCGYTGEDGFEISMPAIKSVEIARELLKDEQIKLAGLGARDSLRLEAGLCLYGSDISEKTTPVEAALTWLVDKQRRERADFPGASAILKQIKEGSKIKRVGLVSRDGPPARHDAVITDESGNNDLGMVTSGCPAPSVGKNVAMGYVPTEMSKVGTNLNFKIRGKLYPAVVAKMPFVKSNYYTKPKSAPGAPDNLGPPTGTGPDGEVIGGPRTPQQVAAQKRLQQTQAQVDEVVDIMKTNVEKVLERDQKLSELDDRADALQQGASQFEQQAGKLKRKFWLQNLKMMIIMGVIGLVILIIIVMKFMPDTPQQQPFQYGPANYAPPPPPPAASQQTPAVAANG